MILRDAAGSAIGHTEVYEVTDPVIHDIPTAYLAGKGETDAQAFIYAMNATIY